MLRFLSSQSPAVGQPESPPKSNPMNGLMNPCALDSRGAAATSTSVSSAGSNTCEGLRRMGVLEPRTFMNGELRRGGAPLEAPPTLMPHQNSTRAPNDAVNGRPTGGPNPGPASETGWRTADADA